MEATNEQRTVSLVNVTMTEIANFSGMAAIAPMTAEQNKATEEQQTVNLATMVEATEEQRTVNLANVTMAEIANFREMAAITSMTAEQNATAEQNDATDEQQTVNLATVAEATGEQRTINLVNGTMAEIVNIREMAAITSVTAEQKATAEKNGTMDEQQTVNLATMAEATDEQRTVNLANVTMAEIANFYEMAARTPMTAEQKAMTREFKKRRMLVDKEIRALQFLIKCKEKGLIPRFLRIKRKQKRHNKRMEEAELSMLRNEIGYTRWKLTKDETELYKMHLKYANQLPELKLNLNMKKLENIRKREEEEDKVRHNNKIQWWERQKMKNENKNVTKQTIGYINLSNKEINEEEHAVLKFGPKHVWNKKPEIKATIPEIDNVLKATKEESTPVLKKEFCNRISNTIKRKNKEISILKNLKKDETITIIKADKTTKFVIMNKPEYERKVEEAMSKLNVKQLQEDPTQEIAKKVANLGKLKHMPEEIKKGCILPALPAKPKLFMQAKVHKEGIPLRPMVNKRGTVTYELEKVVAKIIEPLITSSKFVIKNSYEAKKKIMEKQQEINEGTQIYSMDVQALYPSINMQKVKRIIIQKFQDNNMYNKQQLKAIERAINEIINNNYFMINGKHYKQEKGAPIGSCWSPSAAEIEMQNLENKIFEENKFEKLILYLRYVDDVLIIWNGTEEEFKDFVHKFNTYSTNINFTIEKEENSKLPFLDMMLEKKNNRIEISVHRKPTNQQIPIHASSANPIQQKRAGIYSNLFRAYRLPTENKEITKEIERVKQMFKNAGYTEKEINKINQKVKAKIYPPTNLKNDQKEEERKKYTIVTYYPELEDWYQKLRRNLKSNFELGYRTPPKAEEYCKADRDREQSQTGVYYIPLKNQENGEQLYYIGQSKRFIHTRIKEHQESFKIIPPRTKLAQYAQEQKTTVDWEGTKIIVKPRNKEELLIAEAIEIILHDKLVINDKNIEILDENWKKLINENKKQMLRNSKIYNHMYNELFEKEEGSEGFLCRNSMTQALKREKQQVQGDVERWRQNRGNAPGGLEEGRNDNNVADDAPVKKSSENRLPKQR